MPPDPTTPSPETPAAPPVEAVALPTDTTPSWEIELLISGALAFASLQLPGVFDEWFFSLRPRVAASLEAPLGMAYFFLKGVSVVLAITFSLHILMRGFWAAALGLHSVFPSGVAWDKLSSGPIYRRVARESTLPLPQFIARLDNAASIGFALGALLMLLTFLSAFGAALAFAVTAGLEWAIGTTINPLVPFGVAGAVIIVPSVVASQLDKRMGARLAPGSRLARWIERFARGATAFGFGRLLGPMMLVFTSRLGQAKGTALLVAMLYAVFGVVFAQALATLGVLQLDGYRYLADEGARVVTPLHYRDQRAGSDRFATAPFLPSEVATGGLLRVFVPWRIEPYDAAVTRACPDAVRRADAADTLAAAAARDTVVACLGRLLDPSLDGTPVVVEWSVATDAGTDLRGLVAYVPIATLGDGGHVLRLTRIPRPRAIDAARREGRTMRTERFEIPFWIDRTNTGR